MEKKNKTDLKETLKKIVSKIPRCKLNTWYFTVAFFLLAFGGSIWVWWSCYYAPKPSSAVLLNFESKKEDFGAMKEKTESAIALLLEKQKRFNNVPDLSTQRELFMDRTAIEPEPEIEPDSVIPSQETSQADGANNQDQPIQEEPAEQTDQ